MARIVHVAVGVIVGDDGSVLIAKRSDNVHQGGLWEFPGGKVEAGETLLNALKRELFEELAINVLEAEPLIKIRHDYGDKIVLLDVQKITRFTGEPNGNEGQPIQWVAPSQLANYKFPAANFPIITAINLPRRLLITGEFNDQYDFISRLERALSNGIHLVQLRVRETEIFLSLADDVIKVCSHYSAGVLLNTCPDVFSKISAKKNVGLHLNSINLLACDSRPVAKDILLSASCHNQNEIEHAQKIGVDFICLSPVLETNSHIGSQGMGWSEFSRMLEDAVIPAYALGGMKEEHLDVALKYGAQGIAAISEWWEMN
jgi:8-oxo-dGTP diphosphatase